MEGTKIIINKVTSEIMQKSSFQSRVYHDEPILTTASNLESYVPQEILDMKKLAVSSEAFRQSERWLFYTQGKFMESFEDDYNYKGTFVLYYPTYRSMSPKQLRGFFSWRTRVRRGEITETSLSFVYLYIYELINLIGVSSAEEGFAKLVELKENYGKIDGSIGRYIDKWLVDYVVYYGLDKALLADMPCIAFDNALLVLINSENRSSDDIFSAINRLSSYCIEKSAFYKKYPEDVKKVTCDVFKALEEHHTKRCKRGIIETLFDTLCTWTYYMFEGAIFYDRDASGKRECIINDIRKYSCNSGMWFCEKYDGGKSRKLGDILRAVDSAMRKQYGFTAHLKEQKVTKLLSSIIEKKIAALLDEKAKNARPEIEIDVKKLGGIRRAADITREKLIVDEPDTENEFLTSAPCETPTICDIEEKAECAEEAAEIDTPLDDTERKLLKCLLDGRPYAELLRSRGAMLSIAVDSINEKLYDMFADTVIVFDGDTPELIDDYTEQLKGLIGE